MNDDIIQFDYLPEEKIVKINLPELENALSSSRTDWKNGHWMAANLERLSGATTIIPLKKNIKGLVTNPGTSTDQEN